MPANLFVNYRESGEQAPAKKHGWKDMDPKLAKEGMGPQSGGDMPMWPEAKELGVDTSISGTLEHVERINQKSTSTR